MARPEGFEPSCYRLEDGCLNPLGYGRSEMLVPKSGIEPLTSARRGSALPAELRANKYQWGDVRGSNPHLPSSQPGALAD